MHRYLLMMCLLTLPLLGDANASCADAKFEDFLARFLTDSGYSTSRTQWPLTVTTEQFGEPSDRTTRTVATFREFWGKYDSLAELLKASPGILHAVEDASPDKAIVTFYLEDADTLFDAKFQRIRGCWLLVSLREFTH